MLIAQITDFHVTARGTLAFGQVDTNAALAAAVHRLKALIPRPDLVVMTGDLANDGLPDDYAMLAELLAPLDLPWCAIPGNHDDRDRLRALCAGQPWLPAGGPFFAYTIDHLPVRVVALDTQVPGSPHGELCAARIDWLEARLAEAPGRPTVLLMHHPPYETGIAVLDALRCFGADKLAALVRAHPAIERILCGHVHRATLVRWNGTIASSAPSTAHQVGLDLLPDAPPTWTREPPAIALHLWRPGSGLVSHLLAIGDYPAHLFG